MRRRDRNKLVMAVLVVIAVLTLAAALQKIFSPAEIGTYTEPPENVSAPPRLDTSNCNGICRINGHRGSVSAGCVKVTDCLDPNVVLGEKSDICGELETCCCLK
jgi:hypothetical protein